MTDATENVPRILLGAGKQAAQVLNLMEWMGLPWQGIVLFDDAFPRLQAGPRNLPVLGPLDEGIEECIHASMPAMVALGSRTAAVRYITYRKLQNAGAYLPSLVHPSCLVAPTARLGQNVALLPGCVIGPNVTLGSLCWLYSRVTLEHDTQVDENVTFGPSAVTSGYVKIGKHAFLGSGTVCAPEVHIGERALIGAGAVVISDIPEGMIAFGVPARVYREAPAGLDVPTGEELQRSGA